MNNTFNTRNIALAAYLIANKLLVLDHIDSDRRGHATFCFDDPNGSGSKHELSFTMGGTAPAGEFHQTIRQLRKLIDDQKHKPNAITSQKAAFHVNESLSHG
jgi:hypothetical protein